MAEGGPRQPDRVAGEAPPAVAGGEVGRHTAAITGGP